MILLGLLAIVVAAIVNAIQERPSEPEAAVATTSEPAPDEEAPPPERGETVTEPLPALLPLPGELREAGGTLWWSGTDCAAASLRVGSGEVAEMPGEHCRVWPSPDGTSVLAVAERRSAPLAGEGLELVAGPDAEPRVLAHTPGRIASGAAWSPDGSRVALCLGSRDGTVVDVFAPETGERTAAPGACFPAFVADGTLAVAGADGISVQVGDRTVFGPEDAARIFPTVPKDARRVVTALAAHGDRLVAGLAVVSPARLLPSASAVVVLEGDRADFIAKLYPARTLPAAVGLSPAGDGMWYLDASDGNAVILSVPGGRRFPVFNARWAAWSPDGRYLATASRRGISIVRWPSGEEVAVVPVDASTVFWTEAA